MAKVVGDIAVQVGADVSGLQAGMKRAGKSVDGFESRAAKMGATFGKVAVRVGIAATAIASAGIVMAKSAGDTAREIQNLAAVSGTGVVEFQKLAAAGKTVGIEQEKLADIFKDVNDKFGDFMATGAGPLADFFENIAPAVGVTADQFARLSGPEALQLYVSSLERAGVSQQQMTFYMEALASDATALVPLLAANGAAMKRFGEEAETAGRIMSRETVAAGVELDRKLTELTDKLQTQAKIAVIDYADEILAAAEFITDDLIPAIAEFLTSIGKFVEDLEPAITALSDFVRLGKLAAGMEVADGAGAVIDPSVRDGDMAGANGLGGGDTSTTGTWELDENGNVIMDDGDSLETTPPKPPAKPPRTKPTRGGGASGPDREDLERLQEQFMLESELVQSQYEQSLEMLREYREAKLGTEAEYNELEARITAEHQDALADLERNAQQARMQMLSGVFGDLAGLMVSENEKLFKIGQAAAVAGAVVDGISAAITAWDKGMESGGIVVAAAMSAASLAKTGSMIASLKSASSSAGGGGAGSASGGTAATAAPVERRYAEFRFEGGNVLDPSALVDAMNDAYDQGYYLKGSIA